jgi:hypothetical protein
MHKLLMLGLLLAIFAFRVVPAMAEENPHDGYMFWMPAGELKLADPASLKEFNYTVPNASFVVQMRQTRFDIPPAQLVIIRDASILKRGADFGNIDPKYTVDGQPAGTLGKVTFVPRKFTDGKRQVKISVENAPLLVVERYKFYCTDDADKLGVQIEGNLAEGVMPPSYGELGIAYMHLLDPVNPSYTMAKPVFEKLAKSAVAPEAARLLRRLVRWCDAGIQFSKINSGQGYYDLGLYCMVNGFWNLAYDCFEEATQLMPKNPDAWYMLGDAASYKYSDLDLKMEKVCPYYRKAADLYPRDGSNTYRTFFGFFKNLRIKENGNEKVLHMTQEQMDYVKKVWEWNSAVVESASKGMLRMVNTYKSFDQEFDGTDDWNPKPFAGLFNRGEVDTFMKMTGWGASDACGADCGPDRSAFVNMGIREWDTILHEWNHTLDWAMITSELGTGVPTTHSSDWCGFEPISSMGMGHHSCNRYYMTPGMYRYVRGSDPIITPYLTDWIVSGWTDLAPTVTDEQLKDEKFINDWMTKVRAKAAQALVPIDMLTLTNKPVVEDGYINLKATLKDAPLNAYAFATTYIYSPKQQKVRMWIGADDNMRMWLNGRLIHKGTTYWACALFTECKEKDMTAKGVMLEKGWNKVVVQISNVQHPADRLAGDPEDAWGFSIRICDNQNREVPGIKWQSSLPAGVSAVQPFVFNPKNPKTFTWEKVADDYTVLIPELTIDNLRAITGYKTMAATDEIFFDLSKEQIDPAIKPYVLDKADSKNVAFNNELNWFFSPKEFAAVVRYRKGNQTRDLLFLRPEVYESYLKLIPVTPEAKKIGIKRHADQVIGYFLTERDDSPNSRIVLVVDTYLGNKLPADEEDLLNIKNIK